MSYVLSLLDKSPISPGQDADSAFAQTIALAQRAEELEYNRFWVAEHHGSSLVAGAAPEILVAYILAKTRRIRVGTGGVMLQHYSPYKVAEVFRVLAALAPGRVDVGIGKAPGGLPFTTRALQAYRDRTCKPEFADQLAELDAFLGDSVGADHPLAGAVASPAPAVAPERILLGGSPESAELAADLGWDFTYAGHFNGDPANIELSFDVYQRRTGRVPSLALYALAAESEDAAQKLVGPLRSYKVHLATGQSVNVGSLEQAAEFARQAGATDYVTEERRPHVISGTPDHVRRELDQLSRRFGVSEFVIDAPVPDFAERLASIELLAGRSRSAAA